MSVGLSWSLLLSLAAAVPVAASVRTRYDRATLAGTWDCWGWQSSACDGRSSSWGSSWSAALACLPAIARFQYDSNFLNNFRPRTSIRRNYHFVEAHLTPMQSIELLIRRRDGGPALQAEAVRAIRRIESNDTRTSSTLGAISLRRRRADGHGNERSRPTTPKCVQQLAWTQSVSRLALGEHALDAFVTSDRSTCE